MDINIHTNISNTYENIEIFINAPQRNEQVIQIENELLKNCTNKIRTIMGVQNNDIFIIKIQDIIEIYTDERNIFCKTANGIFGIKEKLYYLEEILPSKDFIRISNSAIININHVKCFNTSIIGKILVKFKDGTEEIVSKRKTTEIMKFLKERRD